MATFRIETNTGAAHVWATSALEACERARDMAIRHGSDRWRVYATRAGSRSAYGLAKGRGQGSHGSRRARRYVLAQAAETLHRLGYRGLRAKGLKGRHIEALVAHWRRQGLSDGTVNPS